MREYKYDKSDFENFNDGFGFFKEIIDRAEPAHYHDFIEMVYVISGRAIQHINGSTFKVSKGDMIFINYNSIHSFEPIGKFEYINVAIQLDDLKYHINNINIVPLMAIMSFDDLRKDDERLFTFNGVERKEIESLFSVMLIENKKKSSNKGFFLRTCLSMIITLIVDKLNDHGGKKSDLNEIIEYIDENLGEKITLEELAKKCYYNPSYFSRIFKEKFNVNLSTYLEIKRVLCAKKMIEEGYSIEKIVEKVGFSSKNMLYKQFLRHEGITIQEYRKRIK